MANDDKTPDPGVTLEAALIDLMRAYERRIRTDCSPDQLLQQPWRCWEYVAAEAAIARRASLPTPKRMFPIQDGPNIPWDVIAPFDKQCQRNHGGQTLERIAERGGLSMCEALAVLHAQDYNDRYRDGLPTKEARTLELAALVREREAGASLPTAQPEHADMIEQFCRDLNQAHDEVLRAQGCQPEKFKDYDWPEWTPQANSIRWAERLLGKPLSKKSLLAASRSIPAPTTADDAGWPVRTHGLERTSPKGGPFIGHCVYCGAENLPMRAALEPCSEAPTADVQILDAIKRSIPAPTPDDGATSLDEARPFATVVEDLRELIRTEAGHIAYVNDELDLLLRKHQQLEAALAVYVSPPPQEKIVWMLESLRKRMYGHDSRVIRKDGGEFTFEDVDTAIQALRARAPETPEP